VTNRVGDVLAIDESFTVGADTRTGVGFPPNGWKGITSFQRPSRLSAESMASRFQPEQPKATHPQRRDAEGPT
jgi:hypothetical protein